MDREHGRGILIQGEQRLIGVFHEGRCVEELCETCVPALELDGADGTEFQRVFSGVCECAVQKTKIQRSIPDYDKDGTALQGEAIVLFLNGDKFLGHLKAGMKDGPGMYVYADDTAYKGRWKQDSIASVMHPVSADRQPQRVLDVHAINERNLKQTQALRQFCL